ncbi:MAG: peptide deformylase [Peptococcaceae bacterium]|jgi:peptide deformylase|nr:peptide deformylase [Peptococcaceae bacterium]
MAVYRIVQEEDPVLRQKSKKVPAVTPNVVRLLDNLKDTLAAQKTGVGLAAPQIGITKRVIVVRLQEEENFYELINPEIVESEGAERDSEGCLSIPNWVGEVDRAARIRVKALDRMGNPAEYAAEGYLARVFQHEIDHLDGILFVDRAIKLSPAEQEK